MLRKGQWLVSGNMSGQSPFGGSLFELPTGRERDRLWQAGNSTV